jgi:hypothetical protein
MQLSRLVALGLLLLVLPACNAVYMDEPIGETPLVLDPEEWEGDWLIDDDVIRVDVLDAENGILRAAGIEEREDEKLEIEAVTIHFRDGGDWILASVELEDDGETRFVWGVVQRNGEQILALDPDIAKFRALVGDGTLPGHVDGEDVYLGPLEAEHVALILSEEHGFLFTFDDFGVATRITR